MEIPYKTQTGSSLQTFHLQSIIINENAIIGNNCSIRHGLTIGNARSGGKTPIIGNEVTIGAHVCIVGEIEIGDNATIGAGSIVIKGVPANSVAVGNPPKVIKTF